MFQSQDSDTKSGESKPINNIVGKDYLSKECFEIVVVLSKTRSLLHDQVSTAGCGLAPSSRPRIKLMVAGSF